MDRETVRELAELARLELTDDEAEHARRHLGRILEYFDQIRAVDTDGIAGSPYPRDLPLRTRDDTPVETLPQETVLSNAPARRSEQFVVPRVVDA